MRRALKRVLFVCTQNRLRSPTAEAVFSTWEGDIPDTFEYMDPELVSLLKDKVVRHLPRG